MGIHEMTRRLVHLFERDERASELNDEMRLHMELRARKLQQEGASQQEARFMSQRRFGNPAIVHDLSSQAWGWTSWERLFQDLRLGARTLRKTPGFTAVAVLTLALGLGINTAVFSVVNAVMIRSLPYPEPGRLISLWEETSRQQLRQFNSSGSSLGSAGGATRTTVSVANLVDYRANSHAFTGLAAFAVTPKNLTGDGTPERLQGETVSSDFFTVLGITPARGRAFLPDDDREDSAPVALITDGFWRRRLGADTGVLERSILLDGKPYRVIGVLPRDFESPAQFGQKDRIEFYVPAQFSKQLLSSHGDHEVGVVGRLQPGASLQAAQAELDSISAGLARQYPNSNGGLRAVIAPLHDDLVNGVRDSLLALLGASALIVLITCVNVASLLLVRAVARRHESSVRLALGASRFRMVRQFLAESMLVAAAGCASGILLGRLLMGVLLSIAPAGIPQIQSVSMDWRVFAVCTVIATITGLAFGIAPAWQSSQTQPVEALKTTSRNTGAKSQVRWRISLTVAEVALSMVLLVGAGLLLKSFVILMGVDLGFQPDRVLVMNISLPAMRYTYQGQKLQFFERLEESVRTLPGVRSVATSNRMPLRGGWGTGIYVDIDPAAGSDVDAQAVTPGYFETLGIPLMQGRLLTPADRSGAMPVAVVNSAFARYLLPGKDPLGHRVQRGRGMWMTIVGVVNDVRRGGKTENIKPQIYIPAGMVELYPVQLADLAVRTSVEPRQLVNAIQSQVWALDKDQPITTVRTMEEIIDASVSQRRFQTLLLVIFASVAVGLAMIGIFGVLSYSVSQRTPELGLRMALGAQPRNILGMVLKQAGTLIGVGVLIGLGGALALTRFVETMLFGIRRTDWWTYLAAIALLSTVALIAALIPARRGSRVDPIVALRYE
ncbi:MAG TPA: ABC transporter permease [Bryobacteraceae bacterium]|nr:ABC transporter permease [Bryobacteraceae bacterium]